MDEVCKVVFGKLYVTSFSTTVKGKVTKTRKRVHSLMKHKFLVVQMKQEMITNLNTLSNQLKMISKVDTVEPSTSHSSPRYEKTFSEFNDDGSYNLVQNPLEIEPLNYPVTNATLLGPSMVIEEIIKKKIALKLRKMKRKMKSRKQQK